MNFMKQDAGRVGNGSQSGGKKPGLKSRRHSLARAFAITSSLGVLSCQGKRTGKESLEFGVGVIDLGQMLGLA